MLSQAVIKFLWYQELNKENHPGDHGGITHFCQTPFQHSESKHWQNETGFFFLWSMHWNNPKIIPIHWSFSSLLWACLVKTVVLFVCLALLGTQPSHPAGCISLLSWQSANKVNGISVSQVAGSIPLPYHGLAEQQTAVAKGREQLLRVICSTEQGVNYTCRYLPALNARMSSPIQSITGLLVA